MKSLRRLCIIIIICCTALYCTKGGNNMPTAFSSLKSAVASTNIVPSSPAPSTDGSLSGWKRLERFIFLKDAVKQQFHPTHYTTIDQIPLSLRQAFIAVEDRHFYEHHGFDTDGIIRAALVNLQYGQIEEGASTITQQLVKNLFLSHEQTLDRKAEEFLLSIDMELHYSKDEILELYLNSIYFGSNYYGVYDASVGYFGKEPQDLALPETAMLAGLPNAPSLYSPYVDFLAAKKRQFVVLDAMADSGFISQSICEDAKIKPIYLAH
jgi:penicillin-binding protein 1A